jgi:hypothetical protein
MPLFPPSLTLKGLSQQVYSTFVDMTHTANIIKPTQTCSYRKKYVNGSVIGRTSNKIKNQVQRLFRPISIYLCHQKPNPARETVPLRYRFEL